LRTEGKVVDLKDKLANLAMKGDHMFGKDFRNVVGIIVGIEHLFNLDYFTF